MASLIISAQETAYQLIKQRFTQDHLKLWLHLLLLKKQRKMKHDSAPPCKLRLGGLTGGSVGHHDARRIQRATAKAGTDGKAAAKAGHCQ